MSTGRLFRSPLLSVAIISISIFLVDQLTKYLATIWLKPIFSRPIIGDFLRFTYVENPGMAFGITIENRLVFNMLSLAALALVFFYLYTMKHDNVLRNGFAIILGGALGNLFDRFYAGKVVDFVDVEFFDLNFEGGPFLFMDLPAYTMTRWPVFNVADVAITIGMLVIIISVFVEISPREELQDAAGEDT